MVALALCQVCEEVPTEAKKTSKMNARAKDVKPVDTRCEAEEQPKIPGPFAVMRGSKAGSGIWNTVPAGFSPLGSAPLASASPSSGSKALRLQTQPLPVAAHPDPGRHSKSSTVSKPARAEERAMPQMTKAFAQDKDHLQTLLARKTEEIEKMIEERGRRRGLVADLEKEAFQKQLQLSKLRDSLTDLSKSVEGSVAAGFPVVASANEAVIRQLKTALQSREEEENYLRKCISALREAAKA
eukprot:TRINITY_DN25969_c3_g1_i1.p1 TRINITY_DN25969_c3_g1~~TRINITY_DN25969_c3_g1_i1.p1  ORF type:complete len:241 (+),score=64.24 TRINITY_DN25969_c3_g1_i1:51-773(+)